MIKLFLLLAAITSTPSAVVDSDLTALRDMDQALLDAIAPGDRALWDRTLTSDAVYVDENGDVYDRAKFLATLTPLPPGLSGHITITDYHGIVHGDVAIVRHRDDEREDYFGQKLHADYLMTETWLRQNGAWKLALVHAYVVAVDPPPVPLTQAQQDAFVGQYSMGTLTYTIRRDGEGLVGFQGKRSPRALLAEAPDVLFSPGRPRTRFIFSRNAAGEVVRFIDRREGEDLTWRRDRSTPATN